MKKKDVYYIDFTDETGPCYRGKFFTAFSKEELLHIDMRDFYQTYKGAENIAKKSKERDTCKIEKVTFILSGENKGTLLVK